MNWLDIEGKLLRYRYREGSKPCLVLVHEMGGSIESWDRVLPHLPPEQACLVPEMRGMGLSERVRGPFTFADLARDIRVLLDMIGEDDPVVLSGCAVGGGVALQFALDYPERTAAVVPLDPALNTKPEAVPALLALADRMEAEGLRALETTLLDRTYPTSYREQDAAHFETVRGRWLANDPVSFATYLRMLAHTDLFPRLEHLACPVNLGSGIDDVLRPPSYVASVAEAIPGAEVTPLKAAHHVPDQAPQAVAGLIRKMTSHAAGSWRGKNQIQTVPFPENRSRG